MRRLQRDFTRVVRRPGEPTLNHFVKQVESIVNRSGGLGGLAIEQSRAQELLRHRAFQHFCRTTYGTQSSAKRPASSQLQQLVRWLNEKLPRGFENFGKDGSKVSRSRPGEGPSRAPEAGPKNSGGEGGGRGGGGGGGGKPSQGGKKGSGGSKGGPGGPDEQNRYFPLLAFLLLTAAMMALSSPTNGVNSHEISWQEFRNNILPTGTVEKIVVVNKTVARVIMRRPTVSTPAPTDGFGSSEWHDTPETDHQIRDQWSTGGQGQSGHDMGRGGGAPGTLRPRASRAGGLMPANPSYYFVIGSVDQFERSLERAQREMGINPRDFVPVQYTQEVNAIMELLKLLPSLLVLGVLFYMLRSAGGVGGGGGMGGIFKVMKSNAKKVQKEDVNVTFKDVAGVDEAKKEIMEFVDFLKNPKRFTDLGAKIPKGALLVGPPGTGKTLLAKAVAGEAAVPFFSISGSDFIEMFVGVGSSRVRDLFKQARANAPCIVFIDEIDAVARSRSRGFAGGNDERENTLNQLLVEMDGFNTSTGVVVLAGTNRADILDKAILRPGRFDRQITVDKPDIKGRRQIFDVHIRGLTVEGNKDEFARRLAALTPGFAGADIANLCNEAAIVAARRSAKSINFEDFEKAVDRVIGGLESNKVMSPEEKRIVAYHEAGHAIAGWFLEHADPLLKVTIVPRGKGALGYAQYLPKEVSLRTREQILDVICMALGGRASEEIFNDGRITTGASDDLRRVTGIAYSMVQIYGMNEKIGKVSFPPDESQPYSQRQFSEATAQVIDEEARKIVDEAYERTKNLLREKRKEVSLVAEELLSKETINLEDIIRLIGKRPFGVQTSFHEYLEGAWSNAEADDKKKKENQAEAEKTGEEGEKKEEEKAEEGSSEQKAGEKTDEAGKDEKN